MTFKEWSEVTETENTLHVGRDITRDVYTFPNGIKVYHDVCMPWNILESQTEWATIDYIMSVEENIPEGVTLDERWYTEDGFGLPQFQGERSLELAFNFAQTLKGDVTCLKNTTE